MLPVVQQNDVRPTPNRVRETLFNWLQTRIEGSTCLDLFAGSGALGFESVSRGAAKATLVDNSPSIINVLREQTSLLQTDAIDVILSDGIAYLSSVEQNFDIIYLDPPFRQYDLEQVLRSLSVANALKDNSLIYVEGLPGTLPSQLPNQWQWWRQSTASQVEYGLIATK